MTSLQKKISFVQLFSAWGWVVGSGLYIDDIEAEAERKVQEIVRDLTRPWENFPSVRPATSSSSMVPAPSWSTRTWPGKASTG